MVMKGNAILFVWTDIPAEDEHDFNEWYNREHLRDRVIGIPGFNRGRRYIALSGSPKYAAVYEADNADVLRSKAYLALVGDPDEKSRRLIPRFRNPTRTIARVTASLGEGEGGVAGIMMLSPEGGRESGLRDWIADTLLPDLVQQHGIVGAHLWETDRTALAITSARHMRSGDNVPDWLLVVEATMEQDLDAASAALLRDDTLEAQGATSCTELRACRLIFTLSS